MTAFIANTLSNGQLFEAETAASVRENGVRLMHFRDGIRKRGLFTLMVACAFAAGWVRSLFVTDRIAFFYKNVPYAIVSLHGSVECQTQKMKVHAPEHPSASFSIANGQFQWTSTSNAGDELLSAIPKSKRWQFLGFGHGVAKSDPPATPNMVFVYENEAWCIPYWPLVIPLTLVSAWLLLAKPRATSIPNPVPPAEK